jgi:N-acetyllactosaminide beta-1,6-N-acetylglucosaminyltransferase
MHDLVMPNFDHENLRGKQFSRNWTYLLNMASSEFPLRTNYELTRILSIFNGANDIEVINNIPKERILYSWIIKKKSINSIEQIVKTNNLKGPVPHNFTIVKGLAYCSFSRKFVEYALFNEYAKDLLEWSRDSYSPDEWFWATLQYNIQFNPPGGFRGLNN